MRLTMRLAERSYDIIIKKGSLHHVGQLVNLNRKVLIVTDRGVPAQYVHTFAQQCHAPFVQVVEQGEHSKSVSVWQNPPRNYDETGFWSWRCRSRRRRRNGWRFGRLCRC